MKIYNLKNEIKKLNVKQKLVCSIIFLICMITIVSVCNTVFSNKNNIIDYDELTGENAYILSNVLEDNDIYAKLLSISDKIINDMYYYQEISDNRIDLYYEYALDSMYKKTISKKEFINKCNNFISKFSNEGITYKDIKPYSISIYKDNMYVLRYIINYNESKVETFLGITLNEEDGKFYIWYIE